MPKEQDSEETYLPDIQRKLGERIRQLRLDRGWSQDTFAHLVGLNRAYPNKIEKAKIDLRFSTLARMARVFEISVAELVNVETEQVK